MFNWDKLDAVLWEYFTKHYIQWNPIPHQFVACTCAMEACNACWGGGVIRKYVRGTSAWVHWWPIDLFESKENQWPGQAEKWWIESCSHDCQQIHLSLPRYGLSSFSEIPPYSYSLPCVHDCHQYTSNIPSPVVAACLLVAKCLCWLPHHTMPGEPTERSFHWWNAVSSVEDVYWIGPLNWLC